MNVIKMVEKILGLKEKHKLGKINHMAFPAVYYSLLRTE